VTAIAGTRGAWTGFGASAGPYARFWTSSSFAFQVGGDAMVAGAHNTTTDQAPFLKNDGSLLGFAWWVGLVAGM
jgi:hypothetical protein